MKKFLFALLFSAIAIVFIVPLALPETYKVERVLTINAPQELVFDTIADFRTWPDWNPWYLMEPEAKVTESGSPGIVGSSTQWAGDKIGSGSQTLIKVVHPEYLETFVDFKGPKASSATSYWTLKSVGDATKVVWGLKGRCEYPFGRYKGLFMDSTVGDDYATGLAGLKSFIEDKK